MNGHDLVEAVRDSAETHLSRLGSETYLVAATGGTLETPAVLRVAARRAASGRETFEAWADDETGDVASAFAAAAETEADRYDRIVASFDSRADSDLDPDPDDAIHATLAAQTGAVQRVASGLIGRGLVLDRVALGTANFFADEGETERAALFRDRRASADGHVETGADLLDEIAAADGAHRARAAAGSVIARAYAQYVDTLEEMGIDP